MKYFASFVVVQTILLIAATSVRAESTVNVNVKTNTGNNIINGQTTNSTSENKTHIKVTTNGETTEVNSEEQGEIKVRSINGETTVETSPGMKVDITNGQAKVLSESTSSANSSISSELTTKKSPINNSNVSPQAKTNLFTLVRNFIENILQIFGL